MYAFIGVKLENIYSQQVFGKQSQIDINRYLSWKLIRSTFTRYINKKKMKIFAGLIALSAAQYFPSEFSTNDHFWLAAATDSMQGSGGVAQINRIRCDRSINIKVSSNNMIFL